MRNTAVQLIVLVMIFVILGSDAQAQFRCPAGSRPVGGGGGTMCMCPDGNFADWNGCRQRVPVQQPQPTYQPPQNQQQIDNSYATRDRIAAELAQKTEQVARALERLTNTTVMANPIERKDIPLSQGVVQRQMYVHNIAPPPGFSDRFANGTFTVQSSTSTPQLQLNPAMWNSKNWATMQPPAPTTTPQHVPNQPWSPNQGNPYRGQCTFDSPSCR